MKDMGPLCNQYPVSMDLYELLKKLGESVQANFKAFDVEGSDTYAEIFHRELHGLLYDIEHGQGENRDKRIQEHYNSMFDAAQKLLNTPGLNFNVKISLECVLNDLAGNPGETLPTSDANMLADIYQQELQKSAVMSRRNGNFLPEEFNFNQDTDSREPLSKYNERLFINCPQASNPGSVQWIYPFIQGLDRALRGYPPLPDNIRDELSDKVRRFCDRLRDAHDHINDQALLEFAMAAAIDAAKILVRSRYQNHYSAPFLQQLWDIIFTFENCLKEMQQDFSSPQTPSETPPYRGRENEMDSTVPNYNPDLEQEGKSKIPESGDSKNNWGMGGVCGFSMNQFQNNWPGIASDPELNQPLGEAELAAFYEKNQGWFIPRWSEIQTTAQPAAGLEIDYLRNIHQDWAVWGGLQYLRRQMETQLPVVGLDSGTNSTTGRVIEMQYRLHQVNGLLGVRKDFSPFYLQTGVILSRNSFNKVNATSEGIQTTLPIQHSQTQMGLALETGIQFSSCDCYWIDLALFTQMLRQQSMLGVKMKFHIK